MTGRPAAARAALEERLRDQYRAGVGKALPPDGLRFAVLGLPDAQPVGSGRGWPRDFTAVLRHSTVVVAVMLTLTIIVAGALVVIAQPPQPDPQPPPSGTREPTPSSSDALDPLPPASVTLWLQLQIERPEAVVFNMVGADDAGVTTIYGCQIYQAPYHMTGEWMVLMDGRPVLVSTQPSDAYRDLPPGGPVTLRVVAPRFGALEVSPLVPGALSRPGSGQRPASCAPFIEHASDVVIPEELLGRRSTTVLDPGDLAPGTYIVNIGGGATEATIAGVDTVLYLQGPITDVTSTELRFGPSFSCPGPGAYRWELDESSRLLRLTVLDDDCAARRDLFSGALEPLDP